MKISPIPALIFAEAIAIDSEPDAQYLFTVTPGTLSVSNPINEISLATFSPCSASGIAQPTIRSSMRAGSRFGTSFIRRSITVAAISSGRVKRKDPFGALPTAVLYPVTIYASILFCCFNFIMPRRGKL